MQDQTKNSQLSSRTPAMEDNSPKHRYLFIKSVHTSKPGVESPKPPTSPVKTINSINKAKTQRIEYFSDNNLFKYVGFIKSLYMEADLQKQCVPIVSNISQSKT